MLGGLTKWLVVGSVTDILIFQATRDRDEKKDIIGNAIEQGTVLINILINLSRLG